MTRYIKDAESYRYLLIIFGVVFILMGTSVAYFNFFGALK